MVTVANDPARRFRLLWQLVSWSLAFVFVIIGSGYLVGGQSAASSHTLQLVVNLYGGNYHVHGAVMVALGMFLTFGIGNTYTKHARLALQLMSFYALLVAGLIFGGWWVYDITFAAPWWYVLVAFMSVVLLILAPPLYRGQMFTGNESGGDSA